MPYLPEKTQVLLCPDTLPRRFSNKAFLLINKGSGSPCLLTHFMISRGNIL